MFSFIVLAAVLHLTPWTGADLKTATSAAAKFQLTISAAPGSTVKLAASKLADGWIAAFCDSRVCSPMHVTETIPDSGSVTIQFELIRESDAAPHASGAVITADSGERLTVPPATR
jgi:hypothetical protein